MWFRPKSYEVVCIGSTTRDIFFPTDEGTILETPDDVTSQVKVAFELGGKYRAKNRFESVGGVAGNTALGLSRLGVSVACYSTIGADDIGRSIRTTFDTEGVNESLLEINSEAKSDLSAIVVVAQSGDRVIFHHRDASERLRVVPEKLQSGTWLHVSALNGEWKQNLSTILEAKRSRGVSLALNPGQHNIHDDAPLILETLREVDLLLLNKDEAIELVLCTVPLPGDEELNDERFLLRKLTEAGAKVVGMTDGKRGAWATNGTEYWYCPISTRGSVVDSTGAGDAFGSGFFAAHLVGGSLATSLQYGMANSGSVVGFYGAIEGLLTHSEIDSVIKNIVAKPLT